MANRQRGYTAEETQLRSRRNAEGAEMRGLKRQTGGADGRSNAVGSRRNAPAAETRRAEFYGRWRSAVSHRQLASPAPLLFIIYLARALFPTAGAFSPRSPPHSPQFHDSSSARPLTAARALTHSPATSTPCAPSSQPLYRVLAPFAHSCGTQRLLLSTRKVNGQTSKPVNERSTRSNHLTRLLVYKGRKRANE